jgi:hypothetical protein
MHKSSFRIKAEQLQNNWRGKNYNPDTDGAAFVSIEIPYYLDVTHFIDVAKSNFLTEHALAAAAMFAMRSRTMKSIARHPSVNSVFRNMLTAQTLCLNLFADLNSPIEQANHFAGRVLNEDSVDAYGIIFEWPPKSRDKQYLNDGTTTDAFIPYTRNGKRGFLAFDVKYAEEFSEQEELPELAHYQKVAADSGLFKETGRLTQAPYSPIWRGHLLSLVTKKEFDEGFFVFLYPGENTECAAAISGYLECLTDEGRKTVIPLTLERAIEYLDNRELAAKLTERYLGI